MSSGGYRQTERKFLIVDSSIVNGLNGAGYAQGYILSRRDGSVRVRLTDAGASLLTVKGRRLGPHRQRMDSEVPWDLGMQLLRLCGHSIVIKKRYLVTLEQLSWKIDVFMGSNLGLAVAEVELDDPATDLQVPAWCGREVTHEDEYYNEYIASQSYEVGWEAFLGPRPGLRQRPDPSYSEIERKFLVEDRTVVEGLTGTSLAQAYLLSAAEGSVRIRLADSEAAFLTVKGPRVDGARREYECEVPWVMGYYLLGLCEPNVITKMRYPRLENEVLWAIDVFQDANANLVLAEVELEKKDSRVRIPRWCGREVTDDERYYNEYLATHPYETWR